MTTPETPIPTPPEPQPERSTENPADGAETTAPAPSTPAADARPHRHHERKPEGPRRIRNGVKLRSRDGVIRSTPLSDTILRRVEASLPHDEQEEGLRYARAGQIVSMQHGNGELRAKIQGRAPRPYETRIAFGAYTSDEWDRIIEAMAAEAVYVVKLLANELPDGIDTLLEGLGLSLLPGPEAPLVGKCTCAKRERCRHVAALSYVFAEQLANSPLLVFVLRGMPLEQLLERLRQTRTLQARGVASAHFDPMIPESKKDPPPLEMCVDEFWRTGRALEDVQSAPPSKHVAHALLRRLGPSPLQGKFPLVGLLASIYDVVSEHAVKLRDQVEGIEEEEDVAP